MTQLLNTKQIRKIYQEALETKKSWNISFRSTKSVQYHITAVQPSFSNVEATFIKKYFSNVCPIPSENSSLLQSANCHTLWQFLWSSLFPSPDCTRRSTSTANHFPTRSAPHALLPSCSWPRIPHQSYRSNNALIEHWRTLCILSH